MSELLQNLSEPFPREVQRSMKKGGTSLTYIPVSEVITRLNTVLGIENWSYDCLLYTSPSPRDS